MGHYANKNGEFRKPPRNQPFRQGQPFCLGQWRVNCPARELTNGRETRRLSPRAMSVLMVLVGADGAVVSRTHLLDAVWTEVCVGDESLTQAVAELRRALSQERDAAPFVVTVPKSGYRLAIPATEDGPRASAPTKTKAKTKGNVEQTMQAHLVVANARQLRWLHGYTVIEEVKELMDEAVARAPQSADVQAEYAMLVGCTILHCGDREDRIVSAHESAQRAVALRPDLAKSHCAAGFASANLGRLDDCTRSFERAFALDPNNAEIHSFAAQAFFGLGALDTALILAERATTLDSEDIMPPYVAARAARALGYTKRGRLAARVCLLRADTRLKVMPDSIRASSVRATALAMLGHSDKAHSETRCGREEPNFRDMVALGEIHSVEAAVDHLEALVDCGWRAAGWLARDPILSELSHNRRFGQLEKYFLAS
ncbi:MAG: winged helix-turn-helix domain-containing protein [Pseudomonadota bacterium]